MGVVSGRNVGGLRRKSRARQKIKVMMQLRLENCPRLMIEVPPTLTLTLTSHIDLQSNESYTVTTHKHAKGQGQRSLGSKVRVETDGRKEAIALPPVLT